MSDRAPIMPQPEPLPGDQVYRLNGQRLILRRRPGHPDGFRLELPDGLDLDSGALELRHVDGPLFAEVHLAPSVGDMVPVAVERLAGGVLELTIRGAMPDRGGHESSRLAALDPAPALAENREPRPALRETQ